MIDEVAKEQLAALRKVSCWVNGRGCVHPLTIDQNSLCIDCGTVLLARTDTGSVDEMAEEQLAELRAERDRAVQAVQQLREALDYIIHELNTWPTYPGGGNIVNAIDRAVSVLNTTTIKRI